ncbi:unnamed protein product [Acanthoscelides obtectus]|uniref:MADS-box domain-containing protein n=1 Tax=Acanthoscelides obtectus TaxID=200917 RepID=A0A9P0LCK2_ACAOB|nr:unnamed protein product [Acanthoscelides obtectus]CAK1670663.1 Serum response factor homolog [Acanthoscelides obtectus]
MEPPGGRDSRFNLGYSMNLLSGETAPDIYGRPSTSLQQLSPRHTMVSSACGGRSSVLKSDMYDDRAGNQGISQQGMGGLDSCGVNDINDEPYGAMQSKKSPPSNGKKTKGRVKIKMEYIENKLRRYTTFSKRKTGIMKKRVMVFLVSEINEIVSLPHSTSRAGSRPLRAVNWARQLLRCSPLIDIEYLIELEQMLGYTVDYVVKHIARGKVLKKSITFLLKTPSESVEIPFLCKHMKGIRTVNVDWYSSNAAGGIRDWSRKALIQTCLNSPDPPAGSAGGDQRMSATGFEETELTYNISDDDSKVRQMVYGSPHAHAHSAHSAAALAGQAAHYAAHLEQGHLAGLGGSPQHHGGYAQACPSPLPPPHQGYGHPHSHMHSHAQRLYIVNVQMSLVW